MSDALHEHAKMLARNLLRLQICTIEEIAETLELEPREVQELAIEVYDERAEQLTALRQRSARVMKCSLHTSDEKIYYTLIRAEIRKRYH